MDIQQFCEILKKEAECPLCLETVKNPKTFPCLHSFCLECLDELGTFARRQLQKTIKCPVCLTSFPIPDTDTFVNLPSSFHLNRLVDVLTLQDGIVQAQKRDSLRSLGYYPDEEEENINNYVDEDYLPEDYDQDLGHVEDEYPEYDGDVYQDYDAEPEYDGDVYQDYDAEPEYDGDVYQDYDAEPEYDGDVYQDYDAEPEYDGDVYQDYDAEPEYDGDVYQDYDAEPEYDGDIYQDYDVDPEYDGEIYDGYGDPEYD